MRLRSRLSIKRNLQRRVASSSVVVGLGVVDVEVDFFKVSFFARDDDERAGGRGGGGEASSTSSSPGRVRIISNRSSSVRTLIFSSFARVILVALQSRPVTKKFVLPLIAMVTRPPYLTISRLQSSRSNDSRTPERTNVRFFRQFVRPSGISFEPGASGPPRLTNDL